MKWYKENEEAIIMKTLERKKLEKIKYSLSIACVKLMLMTIILYQRNKLHFPPYHKFCFSALNDVLIKQTCKSAKSVCMRVLEA